MSYDSIYSGTQYDSSVKKGKESYYWDDFKFNVNNLRINPATSKPDFDYNNNEYLFDDTTNETIVGSDITRHEFKSSGTVYWRPHLHCMQAAVGNIVWQLEYRLWCVGDAEPSYTTIQSNGVSHTYVSGDALHVIYTFPEIDVSGFDSTACSVTVKITRLANNVSDTMSGDARFKQFDFHVPIDRMGSEQEFIKED